MDAFLNAREVFFHILGTNLEVCLCCYRKIIKFFRRRKFYRSMILTLPLLVISTFYYFGNLLNCSALLILVLIICRGQLCFYMQIRQIPVVMRMEGSLFIRLKLVTNAGCFFIRIKEDVWM